MKLSVATSLALLGGGAQALLPGSPAISRRARFTAARAAAASDTSGGAQPSEQQRSGWDSLSLEGLTTSIAEMVESSDLPLDSTFDVGSQAEHNHPSPHATCRPYRPYRPDPPIELLEQAVRTRFKLDLDRCYVAQSTLKGAGRVSACLRARMQALPFPTTHPTYNPPHPHRGSLRVAESRPVS